jgi:hypothetical protein
LDGDVLEAPPPVTRVLGSLLNRCGFILAKNFPTGINLSKIARFSEKINRYLVHHTMNI